MGGTYAFPCIRKTHYAHVYVLEATIGLNDLVSCETEGLFIEGGIDHEVHVSVHGEDVGLFGIPAELFTELLRGCEGVGAGIAEVLEGVLGDFAWDAEGLKVLVRDFHGVVCRACVFDEDGVCEGKC